MSNADSEIGIITPKIYYKENKRVVWAAGTWIDMTTGRTLFNEGPDKGQFDKITDVQVAPAVIFTRRDIINKIGGFDEIYFAVYEDADFCMRARKAGFRIVYTPFAIAYHNIPKDRSASMKHLLSMSYYVGRNRILFMKKFSNNYFIFLFFLPFYIIYYFVLSIRYLRFSCFIGYLRGTRSGLLTPVNKLVKIDVN